MNTEGAQPNAPFNFLVDASASGGLGDIQLDIVFDKKSVPHTFDKIAENLYKVSFVPRSAGKHRVFVYFNGMDVRGNFLTINQNQNHFDDFSGSPFPIRVGVRKKSSMKSSTVRDVLNSRSPVMMPESPTPAYIPPVSPLVDNSSPLYSPQAVKNTMKKKSNYEEDSRQKTSLIDEDNHSKNRIFKFDDDSLNRSRVIRTSVDETDDMKTVTFSNHVSHDGFLSNERNNVERQYKTDRKLEPILTKTENGYKKSSFQESSRNVLSSENFKNELISHVNRSNRVQSPKSPVFRTDSPEIRSFKFEDGLNSPGYKLTTSSSNFRSTERVSSPAFRHSSPLPMTDRRPSVDGVVDSSSNIRGNFFFFFFISKVCNFFWV